MKRANLEQIVSERLKSSRMRLGLTQSALAKKTGFSLSAIGNWESCQNIPSPTKMGHLARTLEVSIDFLLGNEDLPPHMRQQFPSPTKGKGRPFRPLPADIRAVPIVSWAQAGDLVAYEDLDTAWHEMTTTTCKDENSFAVIISGDSMEPKYSAGDIAIVMPNVEPRNGCLVVAKLKNDGVFFKLFHQPEKGHFRLSSYNTVYQPMDTSKSDVVWIYPVYQINKNVWR